MSRLKSVKKVVIKKSKWLRGNPKTRRIMETTPNGNHILALSGLQIDGCKCCLGFWAEQAGVSEDVLKDYSLPCELPVQVPGITHQIENDLVAINDSCSKE